MSRLEGKVALVTGASKGIGAGIAKGLADAAGKAFLAALHRQGAKLMAADCLTLSIVGEITQRGAT